MNTPLLNHSSRQPRTQVALAAVVVLLQMPLPLSASDSQTSTGTGYLVGVPVPGILVTNTQGQVSLKGNVHIVRVQTSDPRATGRLQAAMDLVYQADGKALFGGIACQEVGTWDTTNPAMPKFTPTGGAWDLSYRGITQADGSSVVTMIGHGIGGGIDGLVLEESINKGPGLPFDPAVPYEGTATVKSAPMDTTVVLDRFDDPSPPMWTHGSGLGSLGMVQANGKLTLRGDFRFIVTGDQADTTAWISPEQAWSVKAGQSLEARVDVVSMNEAAPAAVLAIYGDGGRGYWMAKGRDYVVLGKQNSGFTFYRASLVTTRNADETLVLSLTPQGPNVLVMARILDQQNAGAVLYETSFLDTPAADASLTTEQIRASTGMTFSQAVPESAGAPWTGGQSPWLGVFQYTDGTRPPAEVTFDNFELRKSAQPAVGIQRAVQLTWPNPAGGNYRIEGAPSPTGPWLIATPANLPGMEQVTMPASAATRFFRIQPAP